MSVQRDDYIGFSYNNKHSSELGIVRVSEGSRFNENLLPTIQDKTVQIPGGDGTYFYGSYYTQQVFNVSFAFDSLTEEQIAEIKACFGDKKIHDLIFDERPYKIYSAKVTGSAVLKYLVFGEGDTNRLYKGEGSVQFTCYQPYARCTQKWLSEYNEWGNKNEWKNASGLKEDQGGYDIYNSTSVWIPLWNPGDIETNYTLELFFNPDGLIPRNGLRLYTDNDTLLEGLNWNEIRAKGQDKSIKINTKMNLIEGYDQNGRKTGNLYNNYITSGNFFKIPKGQFYMKFGEAPTAYIREQPIEYNYYYL